MPKSGAVWGIGALLVIAFGGCSPGSDGGGVAGASGSGVDAGGADDVAGAAGAAGATGSAGDAGSGGARDDGGTAGSAPLGGGGDASGTGGASNAGSGGSTGGATAVPCFVDGQCESGSCAGGAVQKLCVAKTAACTSNVDCPRDEFCDGHCKPAAGFGEPCSPGNRCGRVSAGQRQLWCGQDHLCTGPNPDDCPGSFGCGCSFDEQCADDAPCSYHFSSTPTFRCGYVLEFDSAHCYPGTVYDYSTNLCDLPVALGSYCHQAPSSFCGPGQYCSKNTNNTFPNSRCTVSPKAGEACRTPDECEGTTAGCSPCATGLFCNAGVCRNAIQGEPCSTTTCGDELNCVDAHQGGQCDPSHGGGGGASGGGGTSGNGGAGGAGGAWVYPTQAKVLETGGGASRLFGRYIAASGNAFATQAGGFADPTLKIQRYAGTWAEEAKFSVQSTAYGSALAMSGDTVLAGDTTDKIQGGSGGAVYVYVRNGNTWRQQAVLRASDGKASSGFGASVAIDGDIAVVGASVGKAYLFTRTGSYWLERTQLYSSEPQDNRSYGASAAVAGNVVLVGAPSFSKAVEGAVYVFTGSGPQWVKRAKLLASDTQTGNWFGYSLAVNAASKSLVIGAPAVSGSLGPGAAYVFAQTGTYAWTQQARLVSSDAVPGVSDSFGWSVAMTANRVIAGAPQADAGKGAVYAYQLVSGVWAQSAKLTAAELTANDQLGYSVASGDGFVVAGAPYRGNYAGAAYVFSSP